MRTTASQSALEVVGFRALPATADVAVLHLEGRFTGVRPRRFDRLRLHVTDSEGRSVELAPVRATPEAGDGAIPFRAAWAVSTEAVQGADFALAVGHDLLLELPAPHLEAPDGEPGASHVRLAREINELRRRADEATLAWTGTSGALDAEVARVAAEHAGQLEALRAEHAAELQRTRDEHEARLAQACADADAAASRADEERAAREADARERMVAEEAVADDPTSVLPGTPPRTARMRAIPPPAPGTHPRQDLNDISGARAIALALLAVFFLLLLVILGVGPL